VQVPAYTDEPAALVNRADPPTYDPIKFALANHRFPWGRPFTNRNGRVVRLLTYALPIRYGFRAGQGGQPGRLLNPAAVFCTDRQRYCDRLAQADAGTDAAQEAWCAYVLEGIVAELCKLDEPSDHGKLTRTILLPAIGCVACCRR
jgi:Fic family protein